MMKTTFLAFKSRGLVIRNAAIYLLCSTLSMGVKTPSGQLNGLLQNIKKHDLKSSPFYTPSFTGNIDTSTSPWDLAQKNPKFQSAEDHITNCENNIAAYLKSNKICGREVTKELVETKYANYDGKFAILCGGPSSGKSLLLKNVASNSATNGERFYIQVNGRKAGQMPDLFADIRAGFLKIPQDLKERIGDSMLKSSGIKFSGEYRARAIENFFRPENILNVDKLECLVEGIKNSGLSITIIIDEANIYFNTGTSVCTPNDSLLDSLISLKQEQNLSVILAGTGFGFPYLTLKSSSIRYVQKVVALHEIPPNSMLQLLVDDLEIGEELALALISFYGGNLLSIQDALSELSFHKSSYQMSVPDFTFMHLNNAYAEARKKNVEKDFVKVLMLLSEQGFAEIKQNSIVAEILVKENIATYLFSGTECKGIHPYIRGDANGLIPSLQIFRIAIPQFFKNRTPQKIIESSQDSST